MFKKIISAILVVLMVVPSFAMAAKPGDVAGNYYYTDIKTYLRGQLLDSYNVGGKTVIVCEALRDYGFDVVWSNAERKLTITDNKGAAKSTAGAGASGEVGAVAGQYYHTDIVAVFNGVKMESYNLGGITVIPATSLRDLGYDVIWDEANRQVRIDSAGAINNGSTAITNVTIKPNQTYHGTYILRKEGPNFNGKRLVTSNDIMIETSLDGKVYVPFIAFAECMGINYSWDSASSTITVTVPPDSQLKPKKTTYTTVYKTYGTIEHEIKDIVLNINNNGSVAAVDAIIYGNEVMVDGSSLGPALGMFCVNLTDFYSLSAMYYLYTGVTTPVSSVNLNTVTANLDLTTNKTIQLQATVIPTNAANKSITWTSSNTSVAEVNSSGLVTAKGLGTATITVKTNDGGKTATCTINVYADAITPVSGVTLDTVTAILDLTTNKTIQLQATVIPTNATNKTITWTSSNTSVAEVNSSGLVTAKGLGTATITVKTNDGGKTATCNITVQ